MAKKEKTPTTAEALTQLATSKGMDISQVFDHFLMYIIWAHTLPEYGKPIEGWPYKPEESKRMFEIYGILINELNEHLKKYEWFDIFGNLYEEIVAGKSRKSHSGQFFTPHSLCDLMTQISVPEGEKPINQSVSDPTCGSGRNLLAFHAKHQGNYFVGEDYDVTCCMMTVCNFILHGVNGTVIWHNTLIPDEFRGGWRVNEFLNNPLSQYYGIPHARPMSEAEYFGEGKKD